MSEYDQLAEQLDNLHQVKSPLRLALEKQFTRLNYWETEETLRVSAQALSLADTLHANSFSGSIRMQRVETELDNREAILRIDIGSMHLLDENKASVPGSELGFRTYHLEALPAQGKVDHYRLVLCSQELLDGRLSEVTHTVMDTRTDTVNFESVSRFQPHELLLLELIIAESQNIFIGRHNANADVIMDLYPDHVQYRVSRGRMPWQKDTVTTSYLEEINPDSNN